MSEVWRGWWNASRMIDLLQHPFKYAVAWSAPVGGANFITAVLGLAVMLYTWWHTKDALPAGIVTVLLGGVLTLIPELWFSSFLLIGFGGAALAIKFIRSVIRE